MILTTLAVLLALVTTVATALSILSVYRVTRRPRASLVPPDSTCSTEPISVLKPLCGADDALEGNLETFFRLTHPDYELIFGVEGEADPAVAVVRRLRARYPAVTARLVVHDGGRGLNPKVSNLLAMLATGSHDVVVVSDSNVAVSPDYLDRLATRLAEPGVGLVSSLFAGVGERTLGATLENLHLAGPVAGGIAASAVLGQDAVCVGKSMMFRRSVLESLGGVASLGSVLAEDYVVGRMFAEAGYGVRLERGVVDNVCQTTTVGRFLHRHLRWGLIRTRVTPAVYWLEPLANPMAMALGLALMGAAPAAALAWGAGLTLARDALQWWRLRGPKGLGRALPLGPIKELLLLGVWIAAPFVRTVSWRGRRYRVSAGTRLYAASRLPASGELRSE